MIRVTGGLRLNLLAASAVFLGLLGSGVSAEAAQHHSRHKLASLAHHANTHKVASRQLHRSAKVQRVAWRRTRRGTWLQCVPYARRVSGIDLRGNADTWWQQADGRYERGQAPQAGAVLSFQASRHMVLGHVAVVTETVNPREILITQANWPGAGRHGNISKAVSVIDVSSDNDWTAVRVELGHSGRYGSVYATNGFIYGRSAPDSLMADAASAKAAQTPGLSGAWSQTVQLASAPNYGSTAIAESAPDRSLR